MDDLSIQLLGPPLVRHGECPIRFERRKVLGLLSYLATTGQRQSRDHLADMFFPNADRDHARGDFRMILSLLKSTVGNPFLAVEGGFVSVVDGPSVRVDVTDFRSAVLHARTSDCESKESDTASLKSAVDLYRGDFLSGFYLEHNYDFEMWQLGEQERLRQDCVYALDLLTGVYEHAGNTDSVVPYCRKWLEIDGLDERAHRRLMRVFASTDRRRLALDQYRRCRALVDQELDAEPEDETTALSSEIETRVFGASAPERSDDPSGGEPHAHKSGERPPDAHTRREEPAFSGLPYQHTSFVGREAKVAEVRGALSEPGSTMVTLAGAPGAGKTRLAVEVARSMVQDFEHGVCFVDLSPVTDASHTVPAVAHALGVRDPRESDVPLVDAVTVHLGTKKLLLVLDNFEHVLAAAPEIGSILESCPDVRALVTSREALRVMRERIIVVPPLRTPLPGESTATYEKADAVRLFEERAVAVQPGFRLDAENAGTIAGICIRLDGLPLAIELAASRLKILTADELLSRLDERLDLLRDSRRDGVARHRTLYSEIDWSFRLLGEAERSVFVRLSLFSGGSSLAAAEVVAREDDEPDARSVLNALEQLVEKHLVKRSEGAGASRFYMLETILNYARRKCRELGCWNDSCSRHARYFLQFAQSSVPELHGPNQMQWIDRLSMEESNLRAALRYLHTENRCRDYAVFVTALHWFWYRTGKIGEGTRWLEQAARLPQKEVPAKEQAYVLHALGWMRFVRGNWEAAKALYTTALAIFGRIGDRYGESFALSYLGTVERWLGRIEAGTALTEKAVRMAREGDDPRRLAYALNHAYATTGGAAVSSHQYEGLVETLRLSREHGLAWVEAHTYAGLGDLALEEDHYDQAYSWYADALRGFRELRDDWLIAWTVKGLGKVCMARGWAVDARLHVREALRLFHALGDRTNALETMQLLAEIESAGRRRERADLPLEEIRASYDEAVALALSD